MDWKEAFKKYWDREGRLGLAELRPSLAEEIARVAFQRGAAIAGLAGEEFDRVCAALMDEVGRRSGPIIIGYNEPPVSMGESASECVKRLLRELNAYRNETRSPSTLMLLSALKERGGAAGALGEAGLLFESKGQDYNTGFKRDDYFPLGLGSYAQMIYVKALRLVSFSAFKRSVKHEAVRDTALDLINYAAFLADWLSRRPQDALKAEEEAYPADIMERPTLRPLAALTDTQVLDHLNNQSGIIKRVFGDGWEQRFPWMAGSKDLREAVARYVGGGH